MRNAGREAGVLLLDLAAAQRHTIEKPPSRRREKAAFR
jgi:hypothetical protein